MMAGLRLPRPGRHRLRRTTAHASRARWRHAGPTHRSPTRIHPCAWLLHSCSGPGRTASSKKHNAIVAGGVSLEWYAVHTRGLRAHRRRAFGARTAFDSLHPGGPAARPGRGAAGAPVSRLPVCIGCRLARRAGSCLVAIDRTPGCGIGSAAAPGSTDGHDRPASFSCDVIAWLRLRLAAIDRAGGLPLQLLGPGDPPQRSLRPCPRWRRR